MPRSCAASQSKLRVSSVCVALLSCIEVKSIRRPTFTASTFSGRRRSLLVVPSTPSNCILLLSSGSVVLWSIYFFLKLLLTNTWVRNWAKCGNNLWKTTENESVINGFLMFVLKIPRQNNFRLILLAFYQLIEEMYQASISGTSTRSLSRSGLPICHVLLDEPGEISVVRCRRFQRLEKWNPSEQENTCSSKKSWESTYCMAD